MIHDQIIRFFRDIPPFSLLKPGQLRILAHELHLEFFPRGTAIPASNALHILKKGWVRSEDAVASIGEPFFSDGTVTAQEDALCYQLAPAFLSELLDDHPELQVFLSDKLNQTAADPALAALRSVQARGPWDDRPLFSTVAGNVVNGEYVTASPDISIREAARRMSVKRRSAIILVDSGEQPVGICTDRDFRARVAVQAVDLDRPVAEVMSAPVATTLAETSCFDVLLDMTRRNIHHMVVLEQGRIRGVLSNHDLQVLQGGSPPAFAEKIAASNSLTELAEIARQLDSLAMMLLKDGARCASLTRIMGELFERLHARIAEIGVDMLGKPPLPFALIVLGSWARREEGVRNRQRNGLIYADPLSQADGHKADEYFHQLSAFIHDGLMGLGFESHGGSQTVTNPLFRQSLSAWKFMLRDKMHATNIGLDITECLDLRPVYGDASLATSLQDFLRAEAREHYITGIVLQIRQVTIPMGFSPRSVVNACGEIKNLTTSSLHEPLTALISALALQGGITEYSSLRRLHGLKHHPLLCGLEDEIALTLEYLLLFRIRGHFEYGGTLASEYGIPVGALSPLERRTLKSVFAVLRKVQRRILDVEGPHHV